MRTSDSTTEVFDALVQAIGALENPVKSDEVSAGAKRWKFAPLPDILEAVRPVLLKHGLALIQEAKTHVVDSVGYAGVATRIVHTSGEWIEFDPLFLPSQADAQSFGSATTYARRYTLCAALGIAADEDDDANEATKTVRSGTGDTHSTPTDTAADKAAAAVVPERTPTSEGGSGSGVASARAYGEGAQPDPSSDLAALLAAFGSPGRALLRAKKEWSEVPDLVSLTPEQVAYLIKLHAVEEGEAS